MGTLQGDLDVLTLSGLLQLLSQRAATGFLAIRRAGQEKRMHVGGGRVTLVQGSARFGARLGEILVRKGRLTADKLDLILRVQKDQAMKIGALLVQENVISGAEMEQIMGDQVAEEVFEVLGWEGASFEFEEGPAPSQAEHLGSQAVTALLLEAARRADEMKGIRRVIKSDDYAPVRMNAEAPRDHPNLDHDVVRWLEPLLDGRRTVAQIADEAPFARFRVLHAIATLATLRLLNFVGHDTATAGRDRDTTVMRAPGGAPPVGFVLLISDLPTFTSYLSEELRRAGYTLVTMPGNADFDRVLMTLQPDVIILDTGTSVLDRLPVCRKLRAASPAPIVVLSANTEREAVLRAVQNGAKDYLVKPFASEVLIQRLRTLAVPRRG